MRCFASSLVVALAFAAAAEAAPDPPRIVPWHLIGNVGFGMTHERVERMYGRAINGNPPRDTIVWQYRGRGVISVIYDERGYVDDISTSSSAYTTRSGIRVGMRIPFGRRRWHGFTFDDMLSYADGVHHNREWARTGVYVSARVRATVQLSVDRRGTVTQIWLGKYLHCPWGDADVASCKLPPVHVPPPPAGTRYCTRPGGPGNFLAASPSVPCATAREVEAAVFSDRCGNTNRCETHGFTCLAYWDGRYDRPFTYTHHAICRNGARRIEIDEG